MATGFAINEVGGGGILIDTVSSTRRAALVNWLMVAAGVEVTMAWTDDMIEQAWRSMRSAGIYCIKVEIDASQAADANVTSQP